MIWSCWWNDLSIDVMAAGRDFWPSSKPNWHFCFFLGSHLRRYGRLFCFSDGWYLNSKGWIESLISDVVFGRRCPAFVRIVCSWNTSPVVFCEWFWQHSGSVSSLWHQKYARYRITIRILTLEDQGYLRYSDVDELFGKNAPSIRKDTRELIFCEADSDQDGCVTLADFERLMRHRLCI